MSTINNFADINETFIIEPSYSGDTDSISACTGIYTTIIVDCDSDTSIAFESGSTIFNSTIEPAVDAQTDLGTQFKRFRSINTVSGNSTVWVANTAYTNTIVGKDNNSEINLESGQITFNANIYPKFTALIDLGGPVNRFRNINTVSGSSTVWESSSMIITPELDLGYDDEGEHRVITANSSIIQNDYLNPGTY